MADVEVAAAHQELIGNPDQRRGNAAQQQRVLARRRDLDELQVIVVPAVIHDLLNQIVKTVVARNPGIEFRNLLLRFNHLLPQLIDPGHHRPGVSDIAVQLGRFDRILAALGEVGDIGEDDCNQGQRNQNDHADEQYATFRHVTSPPERSAQIG